jgi:uncharacterized RDD family membrane protein YckC
MPPVLARRVAAYLLDIAALFAVLAPLGAGVQAALGVEPVSTARGVYGTLLLNFSVPTWAYFAIGDRLGATLGKRALGLRPEAASGARVGWGRALGRTAVKMIPWELTHASAFLLAPSLGEFGWASGLGLALAYGLIALYLVVAWRTGGPVPT